MRCRKKRLTATIAAFPSKKRNYACTQRKA